MSKTLVLLLLPILPLLAGCENDAASMMIDGKDHAISFVREQSIPWVGSVEQRFVVSRFPVCQRRYTVEPGLKDLPQVALYEVQPRLYVAQLGKEMYALGTEACVLQKFKPEDRPEKIPGRLLGSFQKKDDKLVFVAAGAAP